MMIEEDAFSDYLDHLCKSLSTMMNYSPKNAFIKRVNAIPCKPLLSPF